MRKRHVIRYIVPMIIVLLIGAAYRNTIAQTDASKSKTGEKSAVYEGISKLHKRLADAILKLKDKPDSEGKYSFSIKSGNYYDAAERQQLSYNTKAMIYLSQGKIGKIVFEYYQYNFTNLIREVKTLTNTNPSSDDMNLIEIRYDTNTGLTRSYRVGDIKSQESRRDVVAQYSSYLLVLINRLEFYQYKNKDIESSTIERTIQLGN